VELNPGLPWQRNIQQKKTLFTSRLDLNLRKKLVKCYICMVLKLGHFGEKIDITWIVFKCGAGEGWRRSVGPNM